MHQEFRTVYVTCKNEEEATKIAKELVQMKLVACANILSGMKSIYIWEEKLEEETEIVLLLKTRAILLDKIIAIVKAIHSYELPCILSYEILEANQDYLDWIKTSTTN